MMKKDRVWMSTIKSMYPRMMLHKDIKEVGIPCFSPPEDH